LHYLSHVSYYSNAERRETSLLVNNSRCWVMMRMYLPYCCEYDDVLWACVLRSALYDLCCSLCFSEL